MIEVDNLYRDGFAVIPGWLDESLLPSLRDEVRAITENPGQLSRRDYSSGAMVTAHRGAVSTWPALSAYLANSNLAKIVEAYFARFKFPAHSYPFVNEQIEVERNFRVGETTNSAWHFDRVPAVKCTLFLTDTREQLGAMQILPGSQFRTRRDALGFLERNPDPLFIDNYVDLESQVEPTMFEVKAGTLVILDTFAIHRGGTVTEDGERLVIRGVTWPRPLARGYLEAPNTSSFDASYRLFHPYDRTGQKIADQRHLFADHPTTA